jgi:plastocyanin
MMKVFGIIVAGLCLGAGSMALAHDMAGMAAPAAQLAAAEPNTVGIDNFAFGPKELTVAVGTTVTWINHDDEPHTVVSADDTKLFKSGALDTDDKFSFTFAKAGTYQYFCSIHPHMTGTVVVK